ncbi:I78 family peptidase inhibitor [Tropicimonas marinistellae]|uniref:I78 family peptidase inhibitor n=1 Tax=Tropicimonas marinistellae TaxID=1739787 RepID=UPI00082E6FA2|nr:I78 family peptidase inhibitor [Tropicimonas marinistellae]
MDLKFAGLAAALLVLAGCEDYTGDTITEGSFTSPPPPTVVDPIQPAGAVDVAPIEEGGVDPALAMVEEDPYGEVQAGAGGLTERLPDTCKLEEVQQYRGQSAAAVEGAGLTMPYRVIGPSDIVTQEYNPTRVNFFVNTGGTVDRVSCG